MPRFLPCLPDGSFRSRRLSLSLRHLLDRCCPSEQIVHIDPVRVRVAIFIHVALVMVPNSVPVFRRVVEHVVNQQNPLVVVVREFHLMESVQGAVLPSNLKLNALGTWPLASLMKECGFSTEKKRLLVQTRRNTKKHVFHFCASCSILASLSTQEVFFFV